ncbi:short chain dehydrogenase [Actinomadura madurae]|uniref:Short chain dehydrogenase n=1 Tax=Actinomadura madurae TaxID=1993 RepID=A0A1I5KQV9_9ACTN|nr:short chain dehydrogenase [Actinomadura madurae]
MDGRQVAVVTAAAGAGIGSAVARRLAADGFDVVITDAHERRAEELAAGLEARHGRPFLARPLDVTDERAVERVMDDVVAARGSLNVLVNNAGWSKIEPVTGCRGRPGGAAWTWTSTAPSTRCGTPCPT